MTDSTFQILFLVSGVGCFVAAGYLWYQARAAVHSVVDVTVTDTVAIDEITSDSEVIAVEGTAVPVPNTETATLTAPFSGTDCLAYKYSVQEKKEPSNSSLPSSEDGAWVIRDEGRDAATFMVNDSTGYLRVEPDGGEFQLESDAYEHFPWRTLPNSISEYIDSSPAVERQDAVLTSVPIVGHLATWLKWTDRRFVEERLEPNQEVYVRGTPKPDEKADFGEDRWVLIDSGEGQSLVISDTEKQGTKWRASKTALYYVGYGGLMLLVGVFFIGLFLASTGFEVI